MRGLAREDLLGWPRVRVGSASRETELVCVDPDPDTWRRALDSVAGDARAMLTVVSARAAAYVETLPPGVRLDREDETLMTCSLPAAVDAPPPPPGYAVEADDEPDRYAVRLVVDRSVAAQGSVGVLAGPGGGTATYDTVETGSRHRRQGLGRWVMTTLDAYAVAAGARTGILVATEQGSALYTALGWRTVAPMRSVMGEPLR